MAYGIVRAGFERLPEVGARDDHITDRGCIKSVALEILVGADERAIVLINVDRCGTSERKQGQDGNDDGSGEDHGEILRGGWIPQVRECAGEVVRSRRVTAGLLKDVEHHWAQFPPVHIYVGQALGSRIFGTFGENSEPETSEPEVICRLVEVIGGVG